jgi:hypothetical protein
LNGRCPKVSESVIPPPWIGSNALLWWRVFDYNIEPSVSGSPLIFHITPPRHRFFLAVVRYGVHI